VTVSTPKCVRCVSARYIQWQTSKFGPVVTILFFLQGFTYGLLDALNSHFQTTLNITASKPSGLQASYFGTYFICPLTVSDWIARKYGFRVTFMTGKKHKVASNDPIVSPADLSICESGLAVFAIGYLLFWPSGVKKSFSGFAVACLYVKQSNAPNYTSNTDRLLVPGYPRSRLQLTPSSRSVDPQNIARSA
jgi:FHS family L-fucose permease-like MFS transporter